MHKLAQHHRKRDLVSVRRGKIDSNAIQGFVLAHSDELVALQYVCDFALDGFLILRLADITEVRSTLTDQFQTRLLAAEGLINQVPFGRAFDLQDWRSVISQLSQAYSLMILECESGGRSKFAIGRSLKTTKIGVRFQHFSGAGNWSEDAEKLKYKDITCCHVDTNYANVYQRHFERSELQRPSSGVA